jgi:hypothetical protein
MKLLSVYRIEWKNTQKNFLNYFAFQQALGKNIEIAVP